MGGDRDHRRARERGGQADGDGRATPSLTQAQRLQRALAALTGDRRNVAAFRAAPAAFAARHGLTPGMAGLLEHACPACPAPAPEAAPGLVIAASTIHGDGVFTAETIPAGTTLCDVVAGNQVATTASRINQSGSPNTEMVQTGGQIKVVTTSTIGPGDEVVADYPLDQGSANSLPQGG